MQPIVSGRVALGGPALVRQHTPVSRAEGRDLARRGPCLQLLSATGETNDAAAIQAATRGGAVPLASARSQAGAALSQAAIAERGTGDRFDESQLTRRRVATFVPSARARFRTGESVGCHSTEQQGCVAYEDGPVGRFSSTGRRGSMTWQFFSSTPPRPM
jgi:hypothetical protein